MKTLLHTADGKQYSDDYMSVFAVTRNVLNDEIEEDVKSLRQYKKIGHKCSLAYLVIVAASITAYNELSQCDFFVGTKYFYT